MKITYLNPENVPLEKVPAGWMLKTPMHPVKENSYRAYWDEITGFKEKTRNNGQEKDWTYITKLPLPPEYLFDWDGSGLSFDDHNYRAAVEQAWKNGKTIQYTTSYIAQWGDCSEYFGAASMPLWGVANYRIHPKHAEEFGLSPIKIEQMLQRDGKPINETAKPDTDSPEYWKPFQRELCIQWANDDEMAREIWDYRFLAWLKYNGKSWESDQIYRPAPKPLSQEEKDRSAYDEYVHSDSHVISEFAAWKAGISYARKNGALPIAQALQSCISVMEAELRGLAVIQPELNQAKQALAEYQKGGVA